MRSAFCCALFLSACTRPLDVGQNIVATNAALTPVRISATENNKVDVLFMVDNSPSMAPMQSALVTKFGSFLDVFQTRATAGSFADLHIGVVTSDFGAGAFDGEISTDPTTHLFTGCRPSPGPGAAQNDPTGQGLLQAIGAQAPAGCMAPTGTPYIQYAFGANGPTTSNLPAGQDLAATFTCMASVGSLGCGFEHQLESVYQALKPTLPATSTNNAGFLRDDALLAVIFLTNEDDGSVPPTATIYQHANTSEPFDTYRQTHYGVACGTPSALTPYAQTGALTDCVPAPMLGPSAIGSEYDVSRYIDAFTKPLILGGIKSDPSSVVLIGIDASEAPVEVDAVSQPCGSETYTHGTSSTCLRHSCQNTNEPAFFGDPAVRLNNVISQASNFTFASICGDVADAAPDYSAALANMASLIGLNEGDGCINGVLTGGADNANCVVTENFPIGNGATQTTTLPRCDLSGGAIPCWQVETKAGCQSNTGSNALTIDRNSADAPANDVIIARCQTNG